MIILEPDKTQWDLRWKMLGVPVRVHPFFWLAALFLSYNEKFAFTELLVGIACIFVSILVHEFGHALSGRHYGDRSNYVVLYHMGGLCVSQTERVTHGQRIWILFWGPGAGFLLAGLLFGLNWGINSGHIPFPGLLADYAIQNLLWINVVWSSFNLFVPVYPLDGGQIMREIVHWTAPAKGDLLAFTISAYAGVAATGLALIYALTRSNDPWAFFPVILFASLTYSSFHLRRQIELNGNDSDGPQRREAWEQDADWWKKS